MEQKTYYLDNANTSFLSADVYKKILECYTKCQCDENSIYFAVNNLYIGKDAELHIYYDGNYESANELKAPAGQTWIYLNGEICNQAYDEDGN